MKYTLIGALALFLAACGVDGEPVYPTANTEVSLSNSGVSVGTNLAVSQGPLTLSLGLGS